MSWTHQALYSHGERTIHQVVRGSRTLKSNVIQHVASVLFTLLSTCIPPFVSSWVWFSVRTVLIRDRALTDSVVDSVFIASSLPASGWICPIMPQGFHSSPWQSSSLNRPSFMPSSLIINSIRVCRPYEYDWRCMLSLAHIIRQIVFFCSGSEWCYHSMAAPPVCVEGGRALRRNAWTWHAPHGRPVSSYCSTLLLCVISHGMFSIAVYRTFYLFASYKKCTWLILPFNVWMLKIWFQVNNLKLVRLEFAVAVFGALQHYCNNKNAVRQGKGITRESIEWNSIYQLLD